MVCLGRARSPKAYTLFTQCMKKLDAKDDEPPQECLPSLRTLLKEGFEEYARQRTDYLRRVGQATTTSDTVTTMAATSATLPAASVSSSSSSASVSSSSSSSSSSESPAALEPFPTIIGNHLKYKTFADECVDLVRMSFARGKNGCNDLRLLARKCLLNPKQPNSVCNQLDNSVMICGIGETLTTSAQQSVLQCMADRETFSSDEFNNDRLMKCLADKRVPRKPNLMLPNM